MNNPVDTGFENSAARQVPPVGGPRLLKLPSFARALRQRGLMARATMPANILSGWVGTTESWIGVNAVYDSHLRRVAMEHAQAVLRGDTPA